MQIDDAIRVGLIGLAQHKLRALLTMLGVIFGVSAVIGMLAIGEGARQETLRQIEAYGADTIYVRASRLSGDSLKEAKRALSTGLSVSDARYLEEALPFVEAAIPQAPLKDRASYLGRQPQSTVVGVGPGYLVATRRQLAQGRFLLPWDDRSGQAVCVLGHAVSRELFRNESPLGRHVKVGDRRFEVVGVVSPGGTGSEEAGQGGAARIRTRDLGRDVYIPLSVALENFRHRRDGTDSERDPTYHRVSEMILQVSEPRLLAPAREVIGRVLKRRHGGADDVEVLAPLEILEQSQRTQEIFNTVMALIAGLSLLVGGIGIMNIMLASVTERTKEIGIRRSLGATQTDIMLQFLFEAIVLSFVGGLLGILGGFSISQGVHLTLGWETVMTPWSVALGAGVSLVVGVIFGAFPAWSAARLDPVQALRYE